MQLSFEKSSSAIFSKSPSYRFIKLNLNNHKPNKIVTQCCLSCEYSWRCCRVKIAMERQVKKNETRYSSRILENAGVNGQTGEEQT